MKNKFLFIFIIIFMINSCSGFKLKRSERSDEFLIEKKNPLVMPPDINDLPQPNQKKEDKNENDFKEILKSNKVETNNNKSNEESSLKESIIKKIEE